MKGCRTCGLPFEESSFMEGARTRPDCQGCRKTKKAKDHQERRGRKKDVPEKKECITCGPACGPRMAEEFTKAAHTKDGLSNKCKRCAKAYRGSEVIKKSVLRRKSDGRTRRALEKYRSSHEKEIKERRKDLRGREGKAVREKEKGYRRSRRERAMSALGNGCKKCGEERMERLTIDHINDNGNEERKVSGLQGIYGKILKMTEPEAEYQVLCYNHNREKALKILRRKEKNDSPGDKRKRVCGACEKKKSIGEFVKDVHKNSGRKSICKRCCCEARERGRAAALKALGGACRKCGESNKDFLEIDHINDDGAHKRRSGENANTIFRAMTNPEFRKTVQLLCANCNMAKEWLRRVTDSSAPLEA